MTTIGRPIRPWSAAAWVRRAGSRPSCSRLPGRSSKISARISASASRWRSRSEPSCSLAVVGVAVDEELGRPGDEGHAEQRLGDRVVELPGEVGPLLARRQLAGLAAEVRLEALALADVAGRAVDAGEHAVDRRARAS